MDPKAGFQEAKVQMSSGKGQMMKSLEDAFKVFSMWREIDSPRITLLRSTEEIESWSNRYSVKNSWTNTEDLVESL